jgi:hypothetical protein
VTLTVRFSILVLCVVAAAGCDCSELKGYGQKAKKLLEVDKTGKSSKTEPVNADFVVDGTNIFYKGKRLVLGRPVDDWVRVLGPYDRCLLNGVRDETHTVVWDNLGAMCLLEFGETTEFELVFSDHKFSDVETRQWPKRHHAKPIVVDGAVIDKDTPPWKYNLRKRGNKFTPRILSKYEYSIENERLRFYYWIWVSKKKRMITFGCGRSRRVSENYRDPRKPPKHTSRRCCSLVHDAIRAARTRSFSRREEFVAVCSSLPPTVIYCFDPSVPKDKKRDDCPEILRGADKHSVERLTKLVGPP